MRTHSLRRQQLVLRQHKFRMFRVIALGFLTLPVVVPFWVAAWFFIIPEEIRYPGTIIHFTLTSEPPFVEAHTPLDSK